VSVTLDPKPWLFISDQVFGEIRSTYDRGYHGVSGTWWAFSPRAEYEQDRAKYVRMPDPLDGIGLNGGAPRW
jgi:hypothetical protein